MTKFAGRSKSGGINIGYLNEIAEVIETDPYKIRVKVLTSEGCKTCSMKENCALSTGKEWLLTLSPDENIEVGDLVRIEISSGNYLAAGALVFLLPLLLMAIMYFIGRMLFDSGFAVAGAFVGLGIGILVAYLIGRGKGAEKFRYRIIEVLPKNPDAP